jgi:16S rRNA (adenine1518-N6/adenine1519-N6)-dimethyltransferase
LGQNFVVDPNTIRKVLHVAGVTDRDRVLEIGAGAGSLTLGLAGAAEKVTAFEIDDRLMPVLEEVLEAVGNVEVVLADALEARLDDVSANKVVANLPYNVATPVVLRILEEAPQVTELTVMTQREVGERLAASPGSKVYGAPTVAVAFFAEAEVAAPISRRAFWPVPNVDSVLVRLRRHERASLLSFDRFNAVVRTAFAQRRKSMRNSLTPLFGSAAAAEEALRRAEIDPGSRPEDLPPAAFEALTRVTVWD